VNERARSYLHVNCAHCHQFGAGGTANIDLRFSASLKETRTQDVRPVQGTFEIFDAKLIAPGDPYRSVLYYRLAKLGGGRMPHIGSEIIDERGLSVIHGWIRQLRQPKDEPTLIDRLRELDGKNHVAERKATIGQLLSTTGNALMLATALGENKLPRSMHPEILTQAMAISNGQVRDLFERFVPDSQRTKRLGSVIKPEQILSKKGNVERGRELFFKSAGLQCANCHRIAGTGGILGPDLSAIGKKYTRAQILESILEPSKFIEPKYVSYLVETNDGKVMTGLLESKSDREIVLNMIGDKQLRLPANTVSSIVPQPKSIMPELLLRDVTLEQAVDLLDFLAGLK
jgi:putative heme-binding domain-containing protein